MALLRCVGASRRQVFSSVLAEATVVGVVASAIGVVFGVALSALGSDAGPRVRLGHPAGRRCTSTLRRCSCRCCSARSPRSWRPSYRLVGRPGSLRWPRSGLRLLRRPRPRPAYVRLVLGFLLLAGGGLLLAARSVEPPGARRCRRRCDLVPRHPGDRLAAGAGADQAARRVAGAERRGARPGSPSRNAVRNPKRTAATTSALLIGVTLISLTCVGIASVRKTFDVDDGRRVPGRPDGDRLRREDAGHRGRAATAGHQGHHRRSSRSARCA